MSNNNKEKNTPQNTTGTTPESAVETIGNGHRLIRANVDSQRSAEKAAQSTPLQTAPAKAFLNEQKADAEEKIDIPSVSVKGKKFPIDPVAPAIVILDAILRKEGEYKFDPQNQPFGEYCQNVRDYCIAIFGETGFKAMLLTGAKIHELDSAIGEALRYYYSPPKKKEGDDESPLPSNP